MKNVHIGWGPVGMTRISSKENTKLKLSVTSITLDIGSEYQLIIKSEYEETPIWESSNENVIKVDENGLVTVVGYGNAYITVTSGTLKGTCKVSIPKPAIPEEPEEPEVPTSKLDNTKIYYGTIQSPTFMSFNDMTEDDVISSTTINTMSISPSEKEITVYNEGDVVVVLVPSNKYTSGTIEIDGSKVPFKDNVTGTNFHSNGDVKLGDFYVFGQWMLATGLLTVYVE